MDRVAALRHKYAQLRFAFLLRLSYIDLLRLAMRRLRADEDYIKERFTREELQEELASLPDLLVKALATKVREKIAEAVEAAKEKFEKAKGSLKDEGKIEQARQDMEDEIARLKKMEQKNLEKIEGNGEQFHSRAKSYMNKLPEDWREEGLLLAYRLFLTGSESLVPGKRESEAPIDKYDPVNYSEPMAYWIKNVGYAKGKIERDMMGRAHTKVRRPEQMPEITTEEGDTLQFDPSEETGQDLPFKRMRETPVDLKDLVGSIGKLIRSGGLKHMDKAVRDDILELLGLEFFQRNYWIPWKGEKGEGEVSFNLNPGGRAFLAEHWGVSEDLAKRRWQKIKEGLTDKRTQEELLDYWGFESLEQALSASTEEEDKRPRRRRARRRVRLTWAR